MRTYIYIYIHTLMCINTTDVAMMTCAWGKGSAGAVCIYLSTSMHVYIYMYI